LLLPLVEKLRAEGGLILGNSMAHYNKSVERLADNCICPPMCAEQILLYLIGIIGQVFNIGAVLGKI